MNAKVDWATMRRNKDYWTTMSSTQYVQGTNGDRERKKKDPDNKNLANTHMNQIALTIMRGIT